MFRGCLRLVRLSNSLPASMLVLLGAKLTQTPLLHNRLWLAMLAMWCITAFGYVSNDLTDRVEDQVNKPDRPLPTMLVTHRQALALAIALFGAALLVSSQLGWLPLLIALGVLALLLLYNWRLKGTGGLGNGVIAGLAASALLPGVVAVQGWQWAPLLQVLPAALALALFILAREIVKTLEDVVGDQIAGKQTIALRIGVPATLRLLSLLTLLLLCTVGLLFAWWSYAWPAIGIMLIGVVLPLGWSVYYLTPAAPIKRVRTCLALLKGAYFAGILALWLA